MQRTAGILIALSALATGVSCAGANGPRDDNPESNGFIVGALTWGLTERPEGEVLGARAGTCGITDIFLRVGSGDGRVLSVPKDWRTNPIRTRPLEDGLMLLEREHLLIDLPGDPPSTASGAPPLAPIYSLDFRASTRTVLPTSPNGKDLVRVNRIGSWSPEYFSVVRFRRIDDHLLYVLFGYDPDRFRWVKLSEPVDLGVSHTRLGWALALLPFCILGDAARFADGVLTDVSLGRGAPWSGFLQRNRSFASPPTDRVGPIPFPPIIGK